jgi:SAM-dependent methyltransferase
MTMLDHENRVRDEFTRQAETFSASAAITDTALTQRFITALGEAIRGSVLDVACGPGILSAAMAKAARDVVAFDLTQMLKKAGRRCSEAGLGARIRGMDGHRQRRFTGPAASRGRAATGQRRCVGRNGIVGRWRGDQVFPPLEFDRCAQTGGSLRVTLPVKKTT